jgi:hypothetical protein
MARAWVGTSGWRYLPWRGTFYPPGLPQRSELAHLAGLVNSVELNGSFYSLQRPESYRAWAAQTPDDFGPPSGQPLHHPPGSCATSGFRRQLLARVLALGPFTRCCGNCHRGCASTRRGSTSSHAAAAQHGRGAQLAGEHDARLTAGRDHTVDADRPLWHALRSATRA